MTVGFLADECVWRSLVEEFRRRGHAIRSVREFAHGTSDGEILDLANIAGEILITEDSDFGHLVFMERRASFGMIFIPFVRFGGNRSQAAKLMVDRIEAIDDRLVGMVTVIEPDRTRQRAIDNYGHRTPSGI